MNIDENDSPSSGEPRQKIAVNFRWWAKKILPKTVVDLLRNVLPESIYYPSYGRTTLSDAKIKSMIRILENCLRNKIDGDIIECGVFRGGSLMQIGLTVRQFQQAKNIYGIDTFEGHPYESAEDLGADGKVTHRKGLFAGNRMERVDEVLKANNLNNVTLHKGMVEDVLPKFANHRFCFAHLDMDLHQSTKSALEVIPARMASGGVICFDDYGDPESPGVKKAVDEILGSENITVTLSSKDGYQAYWQNKR